MFGILQAQAPAKQTATDTISTLSSRLSSAILLEDRRAAILGLRSFAKGYPASVASGALRGLIGSLSKDIEDVDTVKVVLETLLTLFSPDEASPEASDDIALWLADEFTQRQDNITTLLDLLDTAEFYSRLYSLQLLSAILSARPDRTQECVFTAPLGISRLVAVLDDKREAIRNEGLLLLTSLTPSSSELQKLVAFENAFERVFSLIIAEGSLTHGGIIIQDCLSLLANLLRLNVSNQSFFRETGCVPKIARLIAEAVKDQDTIDGVAEWAKPQRDKNLWGVLALLRLFLVQGGLGTQANQLAFWQSGIAVQVLKLAFSRSTEVVVKAEALTTCADLIRGNPKLQVEFAQQNVDSHSHEPTAQLNGAPQQNGINKVNVIHGLLELVLTVNSLQAFDIRLAACECVKSYIYRHGPIRLYFLGRAIDGHTSGNDETPNILTTLLEPSDALRKTDPYKIWLASVLFLHLVFEEPEAKAIAMGVTEGDASKGEEVVTCIQALTGNLIACLQRGEDQRLSVGYLMVLCGWLFEDPDAVNDFLGEGSSVQSLVQATVQGGPESTIVRGLCAVLLGIVYEFSTKDSPIPRATLHSVLSTSLGREQYMDKITRLREHPILRDFEVLHQGLDSNQLTGLPDVYFDKTFVDFLKDNFSRLIRAVDRDPGMEVPVVANGIQKGISRELVDSLRAQVDEKNQALQKAEGETLTLERKLGQEQADHRRTKETSTVDLNRLRAINDSLQKNHESEISQLQERNRIALKNLQQEKDREFQALQMQIQQVQQEADQQALRTRERIDAEVNDLKGTIRKHEQQLERASAEHLQDLQTAHEEYTAKLNEQETRAKRAEEKCTDADARAKRSTDAIKEAEGKATKAEEEARTKEAARSSTQAELDDLLMVLGDLEEKRMTDKKRLKELGESISDEEDGEEDEEDGEDEDEEEDEVPEANTKSSDHDDDVD